MLNYERTYTTARSVFSLLEFIGWAVVAIGVIVAIVGFTSGVSAPRSSNVPPLAIRFLFMLPGIGISIFGLISVAIVQVGRANVDTAEMTRELLALAKQPGGDPIRENISGGNATQHRMNKNPAGYGGGIPADSEECFEYKNVSIFRRGKKYYIENSSTEYASLEVAKILIDRKANL